MEVNTGLRDAISWLPDELLTSTTLVKLTLGTQIYLDKFEPDAYLPALKSLVIDSIVFDGDDLCDVLLRGCPVLEELYLLRGGMSFDTPSLVSLNYRDYALEEYTDVNLASLVEARLDILYSIRIKDPDLSGLIIGISNVEILHLSPGSADVISRCVEDGLVLPVFKNLVKLYFGSNNKRGWKLLPYLIKQTPKLETLIIQGLEGYAGNATIRPFQVKVDELLKRWIT
ncbi:hypothetical protein Bca52824_078016 [Brassica carinata]|uniref:F-box/LRR-repeat protein 15/At3g58940/PEG3-like LRR domain-containing protein n=1 Tax=Brassica carinata TaxID=52824 RepID=A0A8X7TY52_BRACI|nr:hypothetical protein Bca52824_078016 [Brassica carinata]